MSLIVWSSLGAEWLIDVGGCGGGGGLAIVRASHNRPNLRLEGWLRCEDELSALRLLFLGPLEELSGVA